MSLLLHEAPFAAADLAPWRDIPPAVASDVMNRGQAMTGTIAPLAPGMRLCGQARTARCMSGDNAPLHALLRLVRPGEAIVAAAGGGRERALWGGLMTRAALAIQAGGIVVDGAVRDAAEICGLGFPCFAAAIAPAGPHKGFGGEIDATVACAGAVVHPGDIVLGDDDGVAVVPLAEAAAVLAAAQAKLAAEARALERLEAGESLADQFEIPYPVVVTR